MRAIGLAVVAASACVGAADAGSLQSFNLPGQQTTCGNAISSDGTVVGNSVALVGQPLQNNLSLFTWRNGVSTLLSPAVPQGLVSLSGINSRGVLVGTDLMIFDDPARQLAFSYASGQVTMIDIPGAVSEAASGINDTGAVVGYYQTAFGGPTFGFEQVGGHSFTIDGGTGTTIPVAVDTAGNGVAGMRRQPLANGGAYSGFLYRNHIFTTIAFPGATNTFALGLSRPQVVTGTYLIGSTSHGFIYRRGLYSSFDVPGADQTQVGGANEQGQFTGCYTDKNGTHGFVYTPR